MRTAARRSAQIAKPSAPSVPAAADSAVDATSSAVVPPPPRAVVKGLLVPPKAFPEAFPGELREMVIAALSDARDVATQSDRKRRATVLEAVLAENRPDGELDRRRAELRQVLKNSGFFADAQTIAALDRPGFRLVSGKKHWKLNYADTHLPLAKTPSDYRANLNASADIANRCF